MLSVFVCWIPQLVFLGQIPRQVFYNLIPMSVYTSDLFSGSVTEDSVIGSLTGTFANVLFLVVGAITSVVLILPLVCWYCLVQT